MRVSEDDKEKFRELGRETLGSGWQYRLAGFAGVAVRTAQRWAAGTSPVPPAVMEDLRKQREILAGTRLQQQVFEAVEAALKAGLSPHVASAVLKDTANYVKPEADPKDSMPNP